MALTYRVAGAAHIPAMMVIRNNVWENPLVTAPGTRAERLYEHRGWARHGVKPTGEVEFRLRRGE